MPFGPVLTELWISPGKIILTADQDVFLKMSSDNMDEAEIWEKHMVLHP